MAHEAHARAESVDGRGSGERKTNGKGRSDAQAVAGGQGRAWSDVTEKNLKGRQESGEGEGTWW
jgi:hypothetical protein